MSFFNGLIVAREQASGTVLGASIPVVAITEGDKWATPAKMAFPKRKLRLIKLLLDAELSE